MKLDHFKLGLYASAPTYSLPSPCTDSGNIFGMAKKTDLAMRNPCRDTKRVDYKTKPTRYFRH